MTTGRTDGHNCEVVSLFVTCPLVCVVGPVPGSGILCCIPASLSFCSITYTQQGRRERTSEYTGGRGGTSSTKPNLAQPVSLWEQSGMGKVVLDLPGKLGVMA